MAVDVELPDYLAANENGDHNLRFRLGRTGKIAASLRTSAILEGLTVLALVFILPQLGAAVHL